MLNELKNFWYSIGETPDFPAKKTRDLNGEYSDYEKWCSGNGQDAMTLDNYYYWGIERCNHLGSVVYCNPRPNRIEYVLKRLRKALR